MATFKKLLIEPKLQDKTISENGTVVTADEHWYGLNSVTIDIPVYNGEYTTHGGALDYTDYFHGYLRSANMPEKPTFKYDDGQAERRVARYLTINGRSDGYIYFTQGALESGIARATLSVRSDGFEYAYWYFTSAHLPEVNEDLGTSYTEEGWYKVEFDTIGHYCSAVKHDEPISVSTNSFSEIFYPEYFALLFEHIVPLTSTNGVELASEDKQCRNSLLILPSLQNKETITQEDVTITPDNGYCGLGEVIVHVQHPNPNLQTKTATVNGEYTADEGYDGLSKVTVNVEPPVHELTDIDAGEITENGEYVIETPEGYYGIGKVTATIAVPSSGDPVLQDKTVSPSTSDQTITADEGYDGLGTVTVNKMNLTAINVDPSTSDNTIDSSNFTVDGFNKITIRGVTSAIDPNILSANIKKGVVILGVTGTYEGETGTVYKVAITPTYNSITVYDGTDASGTSLGTISSTTTVDCTSGYLYLVGNSSSYGVIISDASGVTEEDAGSGWTLLKVTADGSCSAYNECIVEGSLVTLADGSTKPIEEITYDDELLTWNFDEGKLESRKPCWIMTPGVSPKYWHTVLSDGTEIDLVGAKHNSHRFFNYEQGKFIYANNFKMGSEHTFKQDGSMPIVVSCEPMTDKTVRYFNMMTEHNIGFFANGILVGNRFSNMYHIEDMKFIKHDKSLNNREDYLEVPDRIFYGLRIAEQSEAQNANGSVQFYDTLREHIIHNIVEHDILYTGKKDYVPWKFKR